MCSMCRRCSPCPTCRLRHSMLLLLSFKSTSACLDYVISISAPDSGLATIGNAVTSISVCGPCSEVRMRRHKIGAATPGHHPDRTRCSTRVRPVDARSGCLKPSACSCISCHFPWTQTIFNPGPVVPDEKTLETSGINQPAACRGRRFLLHQSTICSRPLQQSAAPSGSVTRSPCVRRCRHEYVGTDMSLDRRAAVLAVTVNDSKVSALTWNSCRHPDRYLEQLADVSLAPEDPTVGDVLSFTFTTSNNSGPGICL